MVSAEVKIEAKATPRMKRTISHAGKYTPRPRLPMQAPASSIPSVRVRLRPSSSIVRPTSGAPKAMPANITVAVNPIMGVAIRMPSSTTVDTGRTIPNPNPAVKIAKKQAYMGLIFSDIESLVIYKLITELIRTLLLSEKYRKGTLVCQ
jgi:hypothetical protein